jgi:hypothetical protein
MMAFSVPRIGAFGAVMASSVPARRRSCYRIFGESGMQRASTVSYQEP